MNCVSTETLAMYLKNELDRQHYQTVTAHLRTCQPCSQRLSTFQQHDVLLKHVFYRGQDAPALVDCACYHVEDLSAYVTGHLPIQETQALEQHLQMCNSCLREVMAAHRMWHALQRETREAPPEHLVAAVTRDIRGRAGIASIEKLGSLIIQLSVTGLRFLEAAWVPPHVQIVVGGYTLPAGALRDFQPAEGTVPLVEMQQTVRDLTLMLRVIHETPDTVMLRLQLRKQSIPLARQRVILSNAERRLYSRLTAASGEVEFQRLSHGIYTLTIPQEHIEAECILRPEATGQTP